MPTVSTVTGSTSNATEKATAAGTEKLPEPVTNAVEKAQETAAPPTAGLPIPDAVEPYKEAPEPNHETNGKLPVGAEAPAASAPGTVEGEEKKAAETVHKPEGTAAAGAAPTTATATINGARSTPPASPTKPHFPAGSGGSEIAHSIVSSSTADGTPKRKKRQSIFGRLKEVLTPEKRKKERHASVSS